MPSDSMVTSKGTSTGVTTESPLELELELDEDDPGVLGDPNPPPPPMDGIAVGARRGSRVAVRGGCLSGAAGKITGIAVIPGTLLGFAGGAIRSYSSKTDEYAVGEMNEHPPP